MDKTTVLGQPRKIERESIHLPYGTKLRNRYEIREVVGMGGFGITYKVWDEVLESDLAIKEYYPAGVANRDLDSVTISVYTDRNRQEFDYGIKRFLGEARDVAKFNKRNNIVSVYDFFEENGTAYMVMEFLEGCTLKEYMESNGGKVDETMVIHIVFSVIEALEIVHSAGIVHRDISPDNIFICDDGNVKLLDFGAAKQDMNGDCKTVSVVLKQGYAPIEQYSKRSQVGPWTDIYAFGATLYKVITGVTPDEAVDRMLDDTLEKPIKLNPEISKELSDAIMKAMEVKLENRYQSIGEFKEAVLKQDDKETKPETVSISNKVDKEELKPQSDLVEKKEEATKKEPAQDKEEYNVTRRLVVEEKRDTVRVDELKTEKIDADKSVEVESLEMKLEDSISEQKADAETKEKKSGKKNNKKKFIIIGAIVAVAIICVVACIFVIKRSRMDASRADEVLQYDEEQFFIYGKSDEYGPVDTEDVILFSGGYEGYGLSGKEINIEDRGAYIKLSGNNKYSMPDGDYSVITYLYKVRSDAYGNWESMVSWKEWVSDENCYDESLAIYYDDSIFCCFESEDGKKMKTTDLNSLESGYILLDFSKGYNYDYGEGDILVSGLYYMEISFYDANRNDIPHSLGIYFEVR